MSEDALICIVGEIDWEKIEKFKPGVCIPLKLSTLPLKLLEAIRVYIDAISPNAAFLRQKELDELWQKVVEANEKRV